jgi:hypothetical protein
MNGRVPAGFRADSRAPGCQANRPHGAEATMCRYGRHG